MVSSHWQTLFAQQKHDALTHSGGNAQDIEQDSARLLSSGLFKTARPLVFPPRGSAETYPQVRTAAN